jgi:hypothetical protein
MPQPSTIVGWHRWILGWQFCTRHDDEEELLRKQHMAGWGSMPVFFPPGISCHPCPSLRATSLSLKGDLANIGMGWSRPARCTRGVRGSVWESGSVLGADRRRSGPSCVLPKGMPQGQTESGGIVLAAICWTTSAQRRCHPQEALYLPTFSHLPPSIFSPARAVN